MLNKREYRALRTKKGATLGGKAPRPVERLIAVNVFQSAITSLAKLVKLLLGRLQRRVPSEDYLSIRREGSVPCGPNEAPSLDFMGVRKEKW